MLKNMAQYLLKILAKAVLFRHKPVIVGVTGSVGKTTTKDAIVFAVSKRFSVFATKKNFNNEVGVPLTILLEEQEPGSSIFRWIGVFFRAIRTMLFSPRYPSVLVLEMGVDRPGDMTYLLSIVSPDIAVVTGVSQSHVAFFGSEDAIAQEKGMLVEALCSDGVAVLNADNGYSRAMRRRTNGKVILYGFSKRSALRAFNDSVRFAKHFRGLSFKLEYRESVLPVRLTHIIARHHIEAILGAIGVCDALGMSVLETAQTLGEFRPASGRFRVFSGKRESLVIDDTYNASPVSVRAALEALKDIDAKQKIVVLGDMLELGKDEQVYHEELWQDILKANIAIVVLCGNRMKCLFDRLLVEGFARDNLFWVQNPEDAGLISERLLESKTVVLVKGSQGMRMEKVVEKLLAHFERDRGYLVRQDSAWKSKPFLNP